MGFVVTVTHYNDLFGKMWKLVGNKNRSSVLILLCFITDPVGYILPSRVVFWKYRMDTARSISS